MKLTVISLLFIALLLPSVFAISFDFNHPNSINTNENFSVSISTTSTGDYDVKILVKDNKTQTTLSEIYNDGWKNPYYYLKSAFPHKSEFLIKAKSASDSGVICARLRKAGGTSYTEKCDVITMIQTVSDTDTTDSSSAKKDTSEETTIQENLTQEAQPKQDFIPAESVQEQTIQQTNLSTNGNSDKIFLNEKASSTGNQEEFITSSEKLRLYAVYTFTALTIAVLLFFAIKRF